MMSEKLRCPNCGGNLKVANKLIEESEDDFRNLQISTTKATKERQEYFIKRVAELQAQVDMQSKRIDWTVSDNAKKAIQIDELQTQLKDSQTCFSCHWKDERIGELHLALQKAGQLAEFERWNEKFPRVFGSMKVAIKGYSDD
jgi:hypothetical protein